MRTQQKDIMNTEYDICIIGAGMAGATIAAYLAPKGIKIALIDRNFSEKKRIVGELLQPDAILNLQKMGLEHLLDGFDAQPVKGYALFHDGKDFSVPYNRDNTTRYRGMGMHNGRFLQKIRASATEYKNVTKIQGAVEELIENEMQVVTGVRYKDKTTRETETITARLTITSDGFFSSFRKDLSKNEKSVTSFFIGLILTDCKLPYPNHGHVFLTGSTPFICYPISSNEVRLLVDFPGETAPKKAAIKEHLQANVEAYVPESMKKYYYQAVKEENFKVMPNHYMAAKPVLKEGAVLLGDALNMRHPLTGGGITAIFSDVFLLSTHLMAMPDFNDSELIRKKIELYYKDRQRANANVNILANALYGVMSNDLLKTAVFNYIGRGGDNAFIPISILAGLNRNHMTLVNQFVRVAFFGISELLRENICNIPYACRILVDALKIIKPLAKNELSLFSFFSRTKVNRV